MSTYARTQSEALIRDCLGRTWRLRLEKALGTLIDAEPALKEIAEVNSEALSDVCDALRDLIGSDEP